MAQRSRFDQSLTSDTRVCFAVTPLYMTSLDEMAEARGVTRAELLRRIVAAAIVADGPTAFQRKNRAARDELEALAALWGTA